MVRSRSTTAWDQRELIAVRHAKVFGAHFDACRHRAHLDRLSRLTSRVLIKLDHWVCIGVVLVTCLDLLSSWMSLSTQVSTKFVTCRPIAVLSCPTLLPLCADSWLAHNFGILAHMRLSMLPVLSNGFFISQRIRDISDFRPIVTKCGSWILEKFIGSAVQIVIVIMIGTEERVFLVRTLDNWIVLLLVLIRAVILCGRHLEQVRETFAVASDSILFFLRERDVTLFDFFSEGVCDERLVCLALLIRIGPVFLTGTSLHVSSVHVDIHISHILLDLNTKIVAVTEKLQQLACLESKIRKKILHNLHRATILRVGPEAYCIFPLTHQELSCTSLRPVWFDLSLSRCCSCSGFDQE